jgi:hypothetical protein
MKPKNKIHLSFVLTLMAFLAIKTFDKVVPLLKNSPLSLHQIALADENEDEYDEEDNEEYVPVPQDSSTKTESKPETITEIIRLPDQIVTKTIMETVFENDSDRDGLIDKNDPHPNISEIYIVKDENNNGVDDNYEIL